MISYTTIIIYPLCFKLLKIAQCYRPSVLCEQKFMKAVILALNWKLFLYLPESSPCSTKKQMKC